MNETRPGRSDRMLARPSVEAVERRASEEQASSAAGLRRLLPPSAQPLSPPAPRGSLLSRVPATPRLLRPRLERALVLDVVAAVVAEAAGAAAVGGVFAVCIAVA